MHRRNLRQAKVLKKLLRRYLCKTKMLNRYHYHHIMTPIKQEIDENEVSETQIFINEDIQKQETSIVSDCSTIQDLMDLDGGYERCGKCDGEHDSDDCPNFLLPPENHPDAVMNQGKCPEEIKDITLPITTMVMKHKGDGSCLFHAMAHILGRHKAKKLTGGQLRNETARYIEHHEHAMLKEKSIVEWIASLEDGDVQIERYAQQVRQGMWGGTLEIQVVAHIYEVQFLVFEKCAGHYKCIMKTEPTRDDKGYLWWHKENTASHYDSLEMDHVNIENIQPVEQNEVHAQKCRTSSDMTEAHSVAWRKRIVQRNRLSLTKTTTQYREHCGICGDSHTRRRTSIQCTCGKYVHLKCLGFRTLDGLVACIEETLDCRCKVSEAISGVSGKKAKHIKIQKMRNALSPQQGTDLFAIICLLAALVTAQEQSMVQQGVYVQLHGLNNMEYNGSEGIVMKKEDNKVQVQLAGTHKVIKVHCKNLAIRPTYTTSRCKLMKHRTFHAEPELFWPQSFTGTYYDYLRIARTATMDEIKLAYRTLSKTYHPDKNADRVEKATLLFQQILEAYECLSDVAKRRAYDQHLEVTSRAWWQW